MLAQVLVHADVMHCKISCVVYAGNHASADEVADLTHLYRPCSACDRFLLVLLHDKIC